MPDVCEIEGHSIPEAAGECFTKMGLMLLSSGLIKKIIEQYFVINDWIFIYASSIVICLHILNIDYLMFFCLLIKQWLFICGFVAMFINHIFFICVILRFLYNDLIFIVLFLVN
jgi:hypothetical protein